MLLQVRHAQPEAVEQWSWADVDRRLLLQQFKGLPITREYRTLQKQLVGQGAAARRDLAVLEMRVSHCLEDEMLRHAHPPRHHVGR